MRRAGGVRAVGSQHARLNCSKKRVGGATEEGVGESSNRVVTDSGSSRHYPRALRPPTPSSRPETPTSLNLVRTIRKGRGSGKPGKHPDY